MLNFFKQFGLDPWLWQKTGIIDHGKRVKLHGTQPIRALTAMTVHSFINTHPNFSTEIKTLIKNGKLADKLDIQYGEDAIEIEPGKYRTPSIRIKDRTIQLHETFLSYQWCITYAIYTLYVETIDYPKINEQNGYEVYSISQEKIEKAKDLFSYAKSLVKYFSEWDKDEYPNPERYPAENRDYVEQSNIYCTEGIKFILCHEFAHAEKHLDALPDSDCLSCFQDMEFEADNEAIDNILRGTSKEKKFIVEIAIVMGVISMIFFRSTTSGQKHPNVEDRLTNALERMAVDDNSRAWAFACVALELWDDQFNLQFDWKAKGTVTYKQLYFNTVAQIKAKQV